MLKAGVRLKVSGKFFEAQTDDGKKSFTPGTILIPIGIQEKTQDVRALLDQCVQEDGALVYALKSGFSLGGVDLGSPSFETVQMPKVLLVVGPGVSATDAGEVWHLLDRRFGLELSLVEINLLNRIDLGRYTVIAMVGGTYASIDSSGVASVRKWVENGGTLIAMEQAVEWAVNNRLTGARLRRSEASRRDSLSARHAYADEAKYTGALQVDGAILEVQCDLTHPLLYGYEEERFGVFKTNSVFLEPSRNPYATPVQYTQNPLLSWYLNKEYDRLVRNSAEVVVSGLRSGRVILMTDNPNFRAFWFGTNRLFLNAVFFGSTIRASSARTQD